jgi:hypothetical protein
MEFVLENVAGPSLIQSEKLNLHSALHYGRPCTNHTPRILIRVLNLGVKVCSKVSRDVIYLLCPFVVISQRVGRACTNGIRSIVSCNPSDWRTALRKNLTQPFSERLRDCQTQLRSHMVLMMALDLCVTSR